MTIFASISHFNIIAAQGLKSLDIYIDNEDGSQDKFSAFIGCNRQWFHHAQQEGKDTKDVGQEVIDFIASIYN